MTKRSSLALPDAVQNVSVGKDSDVEVWLDDVVELAVLLVPEKRVRHPDLAGIRQGQVFHPALKKRLKAEFASLGDRIKNHNPTKKTQDFFYNSKFPGVRKI